MKKELDVEAGLFWNLKMVNKAYGRVLKWLRKEHPEVYAQLEEFWRKDEWEEEE